MPEKESARLAQAAWEMVSQPDLQLTLDRIMANARELTPASEVSVVRTLAPGPVGIVGTSAPEFRRPDELQLQCGEGPSLHATRTLDVCLVSDTSTDDRWPTWGPAVAELGWNSMVSLPLLVGDRPWGALNLYATRPHSFTDTEVAIARILTAHASIAVSLRTEERRLQEALSLRHVVGQAQGILMERYDLTTTRALAVLRREATKRGLALRAVAEQIVRERRLQAAPARLRDSAAQQREGRGTGRGCATRPR